MEDIYINVRPSKSVHLRSSTNQTGPESSVRRPYRAAVLCVVLLSVFLLAGLISLGVHYHNSVRAAAAELSTFKANLTELLQASDDKLSSLTEEKNELKMNLNEMTEERNELETNLNEMTEERHQLKANLSEMNKELNRFQSLCRQNKTCPAGWTNFWCSCYVLSTESGSWTIGREDCRTRGADLVVIDSDTEQTFVSKFTNVDTWIGLSDRGNEGSWKWVDETPLILNNWRKNQPDNGGGSSSTGDEDCAHIRSDSEWNDLPCEKSLQWICEKML
ncbi:CD209 antigen-like protein E [Anabas testudineus]|uniref:CD209 antigen-like protein E n=1 Tax=Anabas testudineus TaxID=64144 RepID=UPI000E45E2D5|nr:CD209 antigen-like protein E [Anabas testudineus]